MKIICLFAQRVEIYPGQHAPELTEAVDEVTNHENPEYMRESMQRLEKLKANGEVDFWRQIEIEIDDEAFNKAFKPDAPSLTGIILSEPSNNP